MDEEKIENLWNWFILHEQQIKSCVKDESATGREYLVESLNNLILDLGRFYWEIGHGIQQPCYLTISPNGDRELLKGSKKIVSSAPALGDWEFNHSKPAKEWDRTFMLYDNDMIEHFINAANWKFIILNQHGKVQLMLEAENIGGLDSDTVQAAADLVVINEIGEEAKILNVSSVVVVEELKVEYDTQKAEIKFLRNSLIEMKDILY